MTTFDQQAWRLLKRTTRARKHQQRMEQGSEADPRQWLAAVDLDDCEDKKNATRGDHHDD